MDEWRGMQNTPENMRGSHVAIGVFDGVHRGHQQLITSAVQSAHAADAPSAVMTFDPNPMEIIAPGTDTPALTTLTHRVELLHGLGVEGVCVVPFTRSLAASSPQDFIESVVAEMGAAHLVVGENFRFGAKAAGDADMLLSLAASFGASAEIVPLVSQVSSTRIRRALAGSHVRDAAEMLSRWYSVEGVVVRGDLRGRTLGFPTANLKAPSKLAVPADGVYACWVLRGGQRHAAAVSVGTNPTFAGEQHRIEAYILDFSEDIYGEQITVEFIERVRPMEKFDGAEELSEAIGSDVSQTRKITSSVPGIL